MDLFWTWWAVPGTLTLLVAWTAAIVVFRTAPHKSLNRRLAFLLFLEGIFIGGAGGANFLFEQPQVALALGILGSAALICLPFQYLLFLAVSLETPLIAPFRDRRVAMSLVVAMVAGAVLVLWSPFTFITELYHPGWAPWNHQFTPMGHHLAQADGLAALFGLVAALSAYRYTRPGSAARTRAIWFAIAFGFRDLYAGVFQLLYPVVRPIPFWGDFIYNPGQGLVYVAFVVFLAYGVLRTQLFDLDLKVKFALRQSTIGALIGATFFVGSELLENVVAVEGPVLGLFAAGVIVALLQPVQRFAEQFASRVMRGVEDTPAYLEGRKLEVYRAALEGAIQDGIITDEERLILTRLSHQLAISPEEAASAERELRLSVPAAQEIAARAELPAQLA